MEDSKPWYLSQTILANIAVIVGLVLTYFKVDFGAADQAALVQAVIGIATGVAAIWGIIGRITAKKTIGSK